MEEEYLILQNKFRDWFEETVPADIPHSGEADHLSHKKRRRRVKKTEKHLGLLIYGSGGAITFGLVVGFIIYILNLSIWRWNSYNWLIQSLIIFFAMAVGFYISLVKVFAAQKRER
jgi:H+/Cl- antiporter ClcA